MIVEHEGTAIQTPDERLRVFVSSTLTELAEERAAVARAISALRLTPVMFELGARPHPPQELYRAYLAKSDIFVGLYWQRYGWIGPGMNISGLEDEFRLSGSLPRLLYVKKPAPVRYLPAQLRGNRPDRRSSSRMETSMDSQHHLIAHSSNAGQVRAWDGSEGAFWTAQARRFDETLANFHGPFLAAAAIRERDRVLDVGCGTGQATRDVARVATNGSALGVDLSSQMIALAREIAAAEGLDNVEFRQSDAQIHPYESAEFDVVISRMGSMFFGDPIAAFANLQRALRPAGRLILLTWQSVTDNEWLAEFRAASAVGRDLPTPPPDAPGPFALSDPDRVRAILGAAGFTDIAFQALHEPISFGSDPDDAFDFVSSLTGWMREGLDEAGRDTALAALRTTIAEHTGENGVAYQSATWIIQARRP